MSAARRAVPRHLASPSRRGRPEGHPPRGLARLRAERGNSIVEFVVLSVVLLIPCLYLVLTLGTVQGAVFAADVIARDAARIHATDPDPVRAEARTDALVTQVLSDYGLPAQPRGVVDVRCTTSPCASPGADVRVDVRIGVGVPGLGPLLGQQGPIRVGADHVAHVDQYRDVEAPRSESGSDR